MFEVFLQLSPLLKKLDFSFIPMLTVFRYYSGSGVMQQVREERQLTTAELFY
jgi:hypothetical protein